MLLAEVFEAVKSEHARAHLKHGPWANLPHLDQADAIAEEFEEWQAAFYSGDIHGEHGEVREMIQLMTVCARRIMVLTGEPSA